MSLRNGLEKWLVSLRNSCYGDSLTISQSRYGDSPTISQGHYGDSLTISQEPLLKCMKSENPRMNNIFSKKKTKHGMDLRKSEGTEVKFAKCGMA